MRLGINLLLWTGHVTDEHLPLIASLSEMGYDLVEIPIMGGEVAHYARLGRHLDELGLARTASVAFVDPAVDPLAADPARREAAREQLAQWIDCAEALGANLVIGPMYQVLGHFGAGGPTEVESEHAAAMLAAVAPRAAAAGITLALEPLNRFESHLCTTLESAMELAKRVGHPAVGVMVDTFHAHIEEKDTAAAIRAAGASLVHVHASENDRGEPGTGQVDFPAVFAALRDIGYAGDVVVEAFGRAVPELAAATRIWRDTCASPEALARGALRLLRENVTLRFRRDNGVPRFSRESGACE